MADEESWDLCGKSNQASTPTVQLVTTWLNYSYPFREGRGETYDIRRRRRRRQILPLVPDSGLNRRLWFRKWEDGQTEEQLTWTFENGLHIYSLDIDETNQRDRYGPDCSTIRDGPVVIYCLSQWIMALSIYSTVGLILSFSIRWLDYISLKYSRGNGDTGIRDYRWTVGIENDRNISIRERKVACFSPIRLDQNRIHDDPI